MFNRYEVVNVLNDYFLCFFEVDGSPLYALQINQDKYTLFEKNKFAFDRWVQKKIKDQDNIVLF